MAAPKPMTFLKVFLHLHKFLRSKVNLQKQNKFYSWKFSFAYGELWLASQKHVTLLIKNMERSSIDEWTH